MNIAQIETNNAPQAVSAAVVSTAKREVSEQKDPDLHVAASSEQIKQMIDEIQQQLASLNVGLEFSRYGRDGERIAVVVADKETGDVIREIPSRDIQNLYNKISDLTGIIFDRQA